jgi:Circularly permutated YpsA SLOG family
VESVFPGSWMGNCYEWVHSNSPLIMGAGWWVMALDASDREAELRTLVRAAPGLSVLTGGQTGVDTWAAREALRAGLPVRLIFPAGYRQEDGSLTAARRARLRGATLHELGSASFRYRTWTSVYLSDAVVLLDPAGGDGCRETVRAAGRLNRPLLAPGRRVSVAEVVAWLAETDARVLMVAGCRASVLARAAAGNGPRAQLAVIIDAAVQHNTWLAGYRDHERAGRHRSAERAKPACP